MKIQVNINNWSEEAGDFFFDINKQIKYIYKNTLPSLI